MLFSTPIRIHNQSPLKIPHSATHHSKNLTNAKLIKKILIKNNESRPYLSTESKIKTDKTINKSNLDKLGQYPFNLRFSSITPDSIAETSKLEKKPKESSLLTENFKTQESLLSYQKFYSSKKMNLTIKSHFDRFLKSEQTPKNISLNLKNEFTPKKIPLSEITKKNNFDQTHDDQINRPEKEDWRKSSTSVFHTGSKKLISAKSFKIDKNEINDEKKIDEFDPYAGLEVIQSDLLESFENLKICLKNYFNKRKKENNFGD